MKMPIHVSGVERVGIHRRGQEVPRRAGRDARIRFGVIAVLVAFLGMRIVEFVPALLVLKPSLVMSLVALAVIVLDSGGRGNESPIRLGGFRWILAFVAWTIVSTPFSVWVGGSVDVLRALLLNLVVVWLIASSPRSARAQDTLQWIFVLSAACLAALVLLLGGDRGGGRIGADIGLDVNDIALILATCVPLAIGLGLRKRGVGSLFGWGSSGLMLVVLVQTGSRGGFVALVAGLLVLLMTARVRSSLFAMLAIVPTAALTWLYAPEVFRQRVGSLLSWESDYNVTDKDGRIPIWKRGIRYGIEHPIVGVGPGGFIAYEGVDAEQTGRQGKWSAAHSIYVQALAETGFVGLILVSGAVLSVARRCFEARRSRDQVVIGKPELLASLFAFASGAAFLSFLYYNYTWLLLVALLVLAHRSDKGEQSAANVWLGNNRVGAVGLRNAYARGKNRLPSFGRVAVR